MTDFTVRITVAALLQLMAIGVHAGAMPSLYMRLGGNEGVTQIANDLADRVAADPRIGTSFEGSNLRRIKQKLSEQLCELAAPYTTNIIQVGPNAVTIPVQTSVDHGAAAPAPWPE